MDTDNATQGMDKARAVSYARDKTRPRNEFNKWLETQNSIANSYELEDNVSMTDFPRPPGMDAFVPGWMQRGDSAH